MFNFKKSLVLLFLPFYVLLGEFDTLSTSPKSYFISLSAYISGGINTVSAPGRENFPLLNTVPSAFVSFRWVLDENLQTTLGVQSGFLSQNFRIKSQNLAEEFIFSNNSFDFTINYFLLDFLFTTYDFTFGFGYKYPLGGQFRGEIPYEYLTAVFDCLLGYSITLYTDADNSIYVSFLLRYPLRKVYKNYPESDPLLPFENVNQKQNITSRHNPAPLWLGFGIVYSYSF